MKMQLLDWVSALLAPWRVGLAALVVGCEACGHPSSWPARRLWMYGMVVTAGRIVADIAGAAPRITSGYRCEPCNTDRGGVPGSRHKAGTDGGEPYAALDLQWSSIIYVRRLLPWLAASGPGRTYIGDRVRAVLGYGFGVGVIVYGRRIHLDLRARDYVEIKPDAGLSI